jgi:hypothetical protein
MASIDFVRSQTSVEQRRCEKRHARLMFGIAYPFCLAMAIGARLTDESRSGKRSQSRLRAGRRQSVFREAKAAAASCVPFAFR